MIDENDAPIGHFVFTEQLIPLGCCCYPRAVRSTIKLNDTPSNPKEIALLALYTELGKGLPVANPCTNCCTIGSGVPMPMGNSWADVGMNVTTDWKSTEEANKASADEEKKELERSQQAPAFDWTNQA